MADNQVDPLLGAADLYAIVDLWDPALIASREAKYELVDQARRLIEAVALLDADGDPQALSGVSKSMRELVGDLDALPSLRATGLAASEGADRVIAERSPYAGRSNPLAPPLQFSVEGGRTIAVAKFGAAYEGPSGAVHGGVVAAAFDTLFGIAHRASGLAGVTGELRVRYHSPTPLHLPVHYEAWVKDVVGRKVFCEARSIASGLLVAEASSIFVSRTAATG
jgi:acyl-coenzyme A thioesterase PaaI-like protein